jgi:hypothetical protein
MRRVAVTNRKDSMLRTRSSLVAAAVAAGLGLSLTTAATAGAAKKKPPATVTACVNAKSGATKVLLGKKAKTKCAKGWKKVTWNVAGAKGRTGLNGKDGVNGANGANGKDGSNAPPIQVRDATGRSLGSLVGSFPLFGPMPIFFVLAPDGGIYSYAESGQLFPMASGSPSFMDAACSGPAYLPTPAEVWNGMMSRLVGGTTRIVYRASNGPLPLDLGPARGWKLTSTTSVVPSPAPQLYELDNGGACSALDPGDLPAPGELLVALESIPAPPDGVGGLRVG